MNEKTDDIKCNRELSIDTFLHKHLIFVKKPDLEQRGFIDDRGRPEEQSVILNKKIRSRGKRLHK